MNLLEKLKFINKRWALYILGFMLVSVIVVGVYWSQEPPLLNAEEYAQQQANAMNRKVTTGFTSTAAAYYIVDNLLHKSGGYISNDKMPPGVWLDNISSWELGALIQLRDFSRALRKDFSRSQSQSRENKNLAVVESQLNFDATSWLIPSTESAYSKGQKYLKRYLSDLADTNNKAQFYARADNLTEWLRNVETRLGSLSQRLSASVGKERLNTDLAGESDASQSTPTPDNLFVKTPWNKVDNNFYEARGSAWALINLLSAIEIDFRSVLRKKNAEVSLQQIIRELKETQATLYSPFVLNGSGFGFFANHSLVMANYISRANAALIDLRRLLENG